MGGALLSACASWMVISHATPIDRALPLLALAVTCIAVVSHFAMLLAVPLIMAGEIAIADERLRLLWFGAVLAVTFGAAFVSGEWRRRRAVVLVLSAVILLRWIPFPTAMPAREVFLVCAAVGIVAAFRWTPLAVAIAVATILFTPAIPLRTLLLPLLVLAAGLIVRFFGFAVFRAQVAAAIAVGAMMLFFAWSGALARAFALVVNGLPGPVDRIPVRLALQPGEAAVIDVPPGAHHLILSGANVPRLERGKVVGRVDPAGIVLRIGDIADWGALRREHYYSSRNRLPGRPAGFIRGYGYEAWIDGAARFPVSGSSIRVSADSALPANVRLQVEGFEAAAP